MTRKKVLRWHLPMLFFAAMATHTWAQEAAKPVVRSELQKVEATIERIDPATREVTLKGAEGPMSFVLGPEAKNFDKLNVGDKVVVSYYQGIAAQMSKNGVKATEPATSTFAYRAEGGKKPGGGVGASATTTVTIEDVNPETNTVAFKTSDGLVHIVAVKSPNMQKFARTLKRGDSVDLTYTESIAINVVPVSGRAAEAAPTKPQR
jgi:hypothetical protein